jgi:hypothetical protein
VRKRVLVVAVVVVALAAGVAVAAGVGGPTGRSSARIAAQRVLAKLQLPSGAMRSQADPSASELATPVSRPGTPDLVDLHSFWRVPDDQFSVLEWIRDHPPAGSKLREQGTSGRNGSIDSQWVGFSFVGFPTEWLSETLLVTVAAARGGGTAVRADAQVVWLLKRAASERIPARARAVIASERTAFRRQGPWSVADVARVKRAVSVIDALPVVQPGWFSCPGDNGPIATLTFTTAASGGRRLATAIVDGGGCEAVQLWINGHWERALQGGPRLLDQLSSALGISL